MRRPSFAAVAAWCAGLAALAGGCSGKDPYNPGTAIGIFHVTGTLTTNGCVAPGGAPDPWEFDVKLNRDGSTLYWIQGGLPVQGTLDANQHALMSSSDTQQITAADPTHKISGCSLQRADRLEATLAAGSPVPSFTGSLGYTFSPTQDSDCSSQLAVAGGTWANLPCDIAYTLTATKSDKTTLTY